MSVGIGPYGLPFFFYCNYILQQFHNNHKQELYSLVSCKSFSNRLQLSINSDGISGKTLKINGLAKFFNLVNFKNAEFTFYEDNIEYLKAVCDRFNIKGVYVPSKQGH